MTQVNTTLGYEVKKSKVRTHIRPIKYKTRSAINKNPVELSAGLLFCIFQETCQEFRTDKRVKNNQQHKERYDCKNEGALLRRYGKARLLRRFKTAVNSFPGM